MKAYHGTVTHNAERLIAALEHPEHPSTGLDALIYVTDTAARATRYANAQATREINLSLDQALAERACIIEVETPDAPFRSRGENYTGSLDAVELTVRIPDTTIVSVTVRAAAYWNCSSHKAIARLREILGDRLIVL